MRIPLCDVNAEYQYLKEDIDLAISRVINNSAFINGKEVRAFEENYAEYCEAPYCIGVSSATDGLAIALKTFKITEGKKVAIQANTVTADIECILMAGATPVIYDIREDYQLNFDYDKNIDAVIVVHIYGKAHPNIESIAQWCKDNNKILIEDCSHAHGATINNRKVGTFGHAAVWSFFPSKVLGCFGDGGAITMYDETCSLIARAMRDHGRFQGEKHSHSIDGYNCRLDGIQAAILNAKLYRFDELLILRRSAAHYYNKRLGAVDNPEHSYYVYTIETNCRESLQDKMKAKGIGTGLHYPIPLHLQPVYKYRFINKISNNKSIAEQVSNRILSIPMYSMITANQQDEVLECLK